MISSADMPESLQLLREILVRTIADNSVKIYLFGSWAQNRNKTSSDIDIAIWHPASPGAEFFANLRNIIEDSAIPYHVDIIDLHHADPSLADKVRKEGILWNNWQNG